MAGEWSSDDPVGLLNEFAKYVNELIPPALQRLRPLAVVRPPRSQHNSRAQARRNIAEHYDLSNDLFAEFLDETMTYSSALFETLPASQCRPARRAAPQDRPPAGRGACRPRQPGVGDRHRLGRTVPARRGAGRSRPLDHPVGRAAAAGPAAGGDGRPVGSGRDRAVRLPRRGWALRRRALRGDDRGGRLPVLADVLPDTRPIGDAGLAGSRSRPSPCRTTECWPPATPTRGSRSTSSPAACCRRRRRSCRSPSGDTRLRTVDMYSLRPHYAETLRLWRERFTERRDAMAALGFDEVFHRMWGLYLAYSEAGFESGYLDVYQWTFAPTGSGR